MKEEQYTGTQGIPLAPSINSLLDDTGINEKQFSVRRTLFITALAFVNAIAVGFIAKGLDMLINFTTSICFYGRPATERVSPAGNHLGLWVIALPVAGGIIVGLMARYGSKAIRGHGIPEAMEKILTDESRISPLITFLKPLSAAISIGTGGPFGAEGPIIATGGAFGSVCGQTLRTTARERKVLLAAGATAGMTAIFGTPFAAILLAIELLLFEFSPKSFVPVVIACVTGACCHFLLFSTSATFPMPQVAAPDRNAVIAYALIGILIGLAAVVVTKAVYWIEDAFEKLPIHWMWWPAIGGLVVGVIGYFAPLTLGVGYSNITMALSGTIALSALASLCVMKFASWSIALGSGTSGGTLAPLLTIGSTLGCLMGIAVQQWIPEAHISLPLCALVGMAGLFAGASRALLTAIVFALETTMQENTLLPLIAGCVTSYMISFVFMKGTIMTEKINRRGVVTPESFHPDILQNTLVSDIISHTSEKNPIILFNINEGIHNVKLRLIHTSYSFNTLLIEDDAHQIVGTVARSELYNASLSPIAAIGELANTKVYTIYADNTLQLAVHFLLKTKQDILPVVRRDTGEVSGVISTADILRAYERRMQQDTLRQRNLAGPDELWQAVSRGREFLMGRS
ncbi:MAG: chloride channel protein [Bacteroidetes bacterium]|nr:chloride channel protein [Bacteroidota bacterium]